MADNKVQLEERVIRIGAFPYMEEVPDPQKPDSTIFIERIGYHGQTVKLRPDDVLKGERFDAFVTDADLEPSSGSEPGDSDTALLSWIKGEQPDQNKAPTAPQVVDEAHGDPDRAQRLLAAENQATGGNPRQTVVDGLNAVISSANQ